MSFAISKKDNEGKVVGCVMGLSPAETVEAGMYLTHAVDRIHTALDSEDKKKNDISFKKISEGTSCEKCG